MNRSAYVVILFILGFGIPLSGQDKIDYNVYYRYPFSIGFEYQSFAPVTEFQYGDPFSIYELSGLMRYPFPFFPLVYVAGQGGYYQFDSKDNDDNLLWDHNHVYGALGFGISHRISKEFEIGADLVAGVSQSSFSNLQEGTNVGTQHLILQAGFSVALTPTYNFSINVHPSVKYMHSFQPDFDDFNGFFMGVGFSGHYRFGEDPDSASAIIRSLRVETSTLPPAFAAMQSYYVKNPIGTIQITNTENHPIKDVRILFNQKGFMDSPTLCAEFPEIEKGETLSVDLFASYNSNVFETEGVTPLSGEVILQYTSASRAAEQIEPVSYDLYDKRSLVWDDDRKLAAYITPADSALQNYVSAVRLSCDDSFSSGYNEQLQLGIQIFNALGEIGILYQQDPTSPFSSVKGQEFYVDSVTLPRETLTRITGDCDDLTVLYCSLLEAAGIETAFITVPGHIYSAFNTGLAVRDFETIHPDRSMFIPMNGTLWVPLEITMIGKSSFIEAWRQGRDQWIAYEENSSNRMIYTTASCRSDFRPVGLRQTDLGLQYGNLSQVASNFNEELNLLIDQVLKPYIEKAQSRNRKQDYNRLGVEFAKLGLYDRAQVQFETALRKDSAYFQASMNLANIYLLKEEFSRAEDIYNKLDLHLKETGRTESQYGLKLYLNMAILANKQKEYENADQYLAKARTISPEETSKFAYLGTPTADTGRASEQKGVQLIFINEAEAEEGEE